MIWLWLISKLILWVIHPAHLQAFEYLLGKFGHAQMLQNSVKSYFLLAPIRLGLLIWLGAYFQAQTLGHTFRPPVGLCVHFGAFGRPQMDPKK
jgi:hypothetical protein